MLGAAGLNGAVPSSGDSGDMWRLVVTPEGGCSCLRGLGELEPWGAQPGPSTGRDMARGSVMWGRAPQWFPQTVTVTPSPVMTVWISNVDGKSWI